MARVEYVYKCAEGMQMGSAEAPCEDRTLLEELYRLYGEAMPEKLKGPFAFALYDTIHARTFCARDPLGLAPLYYTKTDAGYRFASNIDTLLSLPQVSKKPNLRSMATMMQCFAVDYHDTMYQGIYRLPPGHTMRIENGEKRIERYWFPEKIEIDYHICEEEAAQKLRTLFDRAVDESISTFEQTAFELSGGLDSSSVVSVLAQKVDPSRIDSYSISFEGLACDEGAYVDALLTQYPLHHRKVPAGDLDYRNAYSLQSLYALSPNWPISLTFAMLIPMLAQMKQEGKKVVVTGQGGDHLFTGTPYVLHDLFVRGKFTAFFKELRSHRRPWKAFKAYVLTPMLGERNVEKIKRILRKAQQEKRFWGRCGMKDLSEQAGIKNPAFRNDLDTVTSAFHSTVMDGNIFHCAEHYFGITYRHPFFDKELVEFALSLPPEMKYGNRTIKRIWRKAMQGVLPEKIKRRRDKAEFSEVIAQQIEAVDLDTFFNDPAIVKLGLLTHADITQCIEAYRSDKPGYVSYLWTMINVEYWYRYNQFEDEKREKPQ